MSTTDRPARDGAPRGFWRDTRAGAAIIVALTFPVLVGASALGAEAGWWLLLERRVQHASDLAAHAAAVTKRSGGSATAIEASAGRAASAAGSGAGQGQVTVYDPPMAGTRAGDAQAVEVRIRRDEPRYFTRIYGSAPVPIAARAVAAVEEGANACLLALSPSASGAVTVNGSTNITFDGCDVATNSVASDSFRMISGSSLLSTGCVNTVGGAQTTAGLNLTDCTSVRENRAVTRDPYADIAEPAVTGVCASGSIGSNNTATTVTPVEMHPSGVPSMRFCAGLSLRGTVTLEPGLYIIEGGPFTVNSSAMVSGAGVTLYLRRGVAISFNGAATLNLSAPATGPFAGLLMFGARDASAVTHRINGTAQSVLNGALYTPASTLEFTGNFEAESGSCTQIVASTIQLSGNSTLRVDCQAEGTRPIRTRETVVLVE